MPPHDLAFGPASPDHHLTEMKMPKTNLKIYFLSLLPVLILSSIVWAQGRSYTVQIASAPSEAEANSIVANLKSKGINAYWTKAEVPGKGTRYRVRIGKYKTQAEAKAMADKVVSRNLITEFIITTYEIPVGGPGASDSVVRNEKKNNPESNPPAVNIVKTEPPKPETAKPEKPKSVEETPQGKERAKAQSPEPPTVTPTRETSGTKPKDSSKDIVKSAPAQSDLASNNDKAPRTPIGPPAAKPERKPEQKVDAPIPVEPKAETSEPVIATPAVADALVDFSISNDNWKIVRRSAETDKNLRSIYFVDAMTGWAAGDAGSAYRTTDGGRSWKPLLSGAPANINFIHFADWNNGWMLGETSSPGDESETILFITTNGGKTWTRKSMPNLLSLHFIDPKNGWAVGKNATLLKTNDGGNQWTKVDSMEKLIGLPVESTSYNYGFRDIQFIDPLHGWLIGNFYGRARDNIGGIFMTTDGGTTWQRVPVTIQTQHTSGRFTPGQYHSVKFSDLNTGSITGEMYDGEGRYFFVLHTRDGGKTWEQFRTPSRATHSTQFLDLANGWMAAFAPREGGAEAVVYDTTLMRTDNGGMSWRNDFIAKGRRIRSVFFLSPTKGWAVGDRGMILRYDEKTKVN